MRLIICVIFIFSILSIKCTKDNDGFRRYIVKAGNNSCSKIPVIHINKHSIQAEFKVNDIWIMPYKGCQNKILGIGEGNHKKNSCRLSYVHRDNLMIVGMYVRYNGEITSFPIDTITFGTYYVDIAHCGDHWSLTFNGKTWTAPAGKKIDYGTTLYPYIGGDKTQTIDKDWIVYIKWH